VAIWSSSEAQTSALGADGEPVDDLTYELFRLTRSRSSASQTASRRAHERRSRGWILRRTLAAADVAALLTTLAIVQGAVVHFQTQDLAVTALGVGSVIGWIMFAKLGGLYDRDEIGIARSVLDDFPGIVQLATLGTWSGLVLLNGTGLAHPRLVVYVAYWALSIALLTVARGIGRFAVARISHGRERVLVVGTGLVAQRLVKKLERHPQYGVEVVGFLDDDPLPVPDGAPAYLGGTSKLEQTVRAHDVERVIVAFSRPQGEAQVQLYSRCAEVGVRVDVVPRMFEFIGPRSHVHDLAGLPLISLNRPTLSRSSRLLKRALDLTVGVTALLLLSPFLLFAALRIKATSPGPVFFRQERMGAGGRRFRIYKFRSMYADADERKPEVAHLNMHAHGEPQMFKISDDPRITPFGRFLRRWSLDELPQLFNVLRGEMSLVGPRPLILDEDEHIRGRHRRRLNLTPGVTGLWQVLGRSEIPFSEMVSLDYLYVTNWSLWGDVKLLCRTVPVVLARRGAF
jgi:exopolysaccharide biosynthesis polyprenyl glycosylphosphotransferase